jgi:restriction system protein
MKISPYDFEKLVVKLLIAMGYGKMEENKDAVTPKSGDGGIDGIVSADKFGFDSIYIQAKQWKNDSLVNRPEIQKFIGALATTQGATKGIFITTSDFTKGAVEIISKHTQNKIVLVNGKQLAKLMIEYDLGVSTVATYKVKRIDSDFFNEDI